MTQQLTDRQAATLHYIIRFKEDHDGISPSARQIMRAVGYQSLSAVNGALNALERRCLIARVPGLPRCIQVNGGRWIYEEPAQETAS